MFPGTIRDNLLMVNPQATEARINEVIKLADLQGYISGLPNGLDTEIGENGVQMSDGERQRLALAQGLLRDSEIILLDEVTANIDNISQTKIKDAIYNLKTKNKITVISISHRIEFLDRTDYIYYINDGRVYDKGTYNDLKNRNILFNRAG